MGKGFEVPDRAIRDTASQPLTPDQSDQFAAESSDQFEIPFQAIHQLGDAAGDASSAAELIHNNPAEAPAEHEAVDSWDAWGRQSIARAITRWKEAAVNYHGQLHWSFVDSPVPESLDALLEIEPGTAKRISRLCAIRQALNDARDCQAVGGEQLGNTMELVLMPWQFLASETNLRIGNTPSLYYTLVELRGIGASVAEAATNLQTQTVRYIAGGSMITPEAYLNERLAAEGAWGVRLMQLSSQPGLTTTETPERSLSNVTLPESRRLTIGCSLVGKLGIFEAIALKLQEPNLAIDDGIWWPANEFTDASIESPNHRPASALTAAARRLRGPERRQVRLVIEP